MRLAFRPVVVVVGSQSTEGIHFLQHARLLPVATGVWGRESTVAIETYPAAAVRDVDEGADATEVPVSSLMICTQRGPCLTLTLTSAVAPSTCTV